MYSPYYFVSNLVTFRDLSIFREDMSIYILLSISAYIERISFLNSWREDLQLTPFPLYTWCSSMAQICACFQWKKICDDSEGKRSIKLYFHIFIYLNKKQKKNTNYNWQKWILWHFCHLWFWPKSKKQQQSLSLFTLMD